MIKVLIVDDEVASREIVKLFLRAEDLNISSIEEAENGEEAIDFLESSNKIPSLIITDMNMPVVDGVSLLQYLTDYYPNCKIIIISGYFDFPYMRAAIFAHVWDYVPKPIEKDVLLSAVRSCIAEIDGDHEIEKSDDSSPVELTVYQALLKQASKARFSLENPGYDVQFESLLRVIKSSAYENAAAALAVRIYKDNLLSFCVDHNYPIDLSVSYTWAGSPVEAVEYLQKLYRDAVRNFQNSPRPTNTDTLLEEVKIYLENNFYKALRLDEIADLFHINKEYLSTIFHKKYGITFSKYILQLKMDEALGQLTESEISISNLAKSLGYEDVFYFSRVFKAYAGISPENYRRQKKNDNKS